MKRKLLTALLLTTLSVNIMACTDKEPISNDAPETPSTINSISSENTESEIISEIESFSETTPIEKTEKTLDDIETYLLEKGVLLGERVRMGADLIGGIDGFKYKDSIGEIYEYDTDSEEYQKLANGEEIPLKGMESYTMGAVSVNGKFVLIGEDVPQDLIDAFDSFE